MTAQKSVRMNVKEVRELMHLKGWNQAELARQLEVTEGAVTRWFKGEHPIIGPTRILLRQWLEQARKEAGEKEKQPA